MTWLLKSLASFAALGMFVVNPLSAQNPYLQPNETWISLDGEVQTVHADRFMLNFGEGMVTVEFDDGDRDADAYKLMSGDKVTVFGKVDADLFETTTIEASSVYVENLGTYFYASAVDEEDTFVTIVDPVVISRAVLQGTVSAVGDGQFTLNTGDRWIIVKTDELPYDPLDDEGYQKIDVGDYVTVTGNIDENLFAGRHLTASAVTTLYAN